MVLANHPARAHVLDRRVHIYHEVLAGFGVNILLRVPENFFISTSWTAHRLSTTLHGPRRMLTTGKPTFAHPERLVLDVDAEVVAGLGVALGRRVDPALAQASLGR